jgi:hypothetical protein
MADATFTRTHKPVIDPVANAGTVDRRVLFSEKVALLVAIAITSVGFFVWGKSMAAQYTDWVPVQLLVGMVAATVAAYVTDLAFREFLEDVVFQLLSAPMPKPDNYQTPAGYIRFLKVLRWVVLTTIVVLLFMADWFSVYTIKDPFADQAKQRELVDVEARRGMLTEGSTAQLSPMAGQIKTLKSDIAATESRVVRDNPGLQKLAREKNAWAIAEMAKKKDRATKSMRAELEKLTAAYNASLASGAAQTDTAIAQMQATNKATMEANEKSKASMSSLFFMFGAGAKGLTVLFRIFLVISFLSTNPRLDANQDGKVDGADVTAAAGGK